MRKKNYFNFLALLVMTVGGMQPASATVYNAKSVIINTGTGSGENFNYTLLGENGDDYQIWGWIKNTDKDSYTYWKIDNGPKLSTGETLISQGYNYHIDDSYASGWTRWISPNKNESYFLKVNSQTSANIIYCNIGTDISSEASDFYVDARTEVFLSAASYDGTKYTLSVSYNLLGPTDALFKNVVAEASFDEGSTWTEVGTYTSKSSYFTATVPWDKTKVRYRLTSYPKDCYKSVVKGGYWTYTTNFVLAPTGISCGIDKAPTADELKSSYNAANGTFNPEITWSTSENMTKAFKCADLYYSYDNGNNWILAKTVTTAAGKDTISVVPGHTSYMFRIAETPIDTLADIDAFKPSNTTQGIEVSYSPAIESVTLVGKVTDGYNETDKTYTHTVKVAINPDLHMTMKNTDKGYINYSTDGGETWSDNIPVSFNALTGEATITVPVKDSYQYRFSANSYVAGTATAVTATSDVYTADDASGIDAVDADGDNSPVDVYNLAGKLVARQILLSEASNVLSNGIYVVKGKVIVINK